MAISLSCLIVTAIIPDSAFAAAGNSQYSLSGARYQLYTNAACTVAAKDANGANAVLTTDANGNANTLKMKTGTYYAKEITAGKGFKLDTTVYTVVITASNTAAAPVRFTSKEPPAYGVPDLMVFKTDTTGKADYTKLLDAEFVVKYFDVDSKEAITGSSPRDYWTFKTVKKDAPEDAPEGSYLAGFDWQHDDPVATSRPVDSLFYTDSSGKRVLPLGWFTIEETKAPEGFVMTDKVCFGHIYRNSSGNVVTEIEGSNEDSRLGLKTVVFENEPDLPPALSTTASISKDNREVNDVISYENLKQNESYVFRGWLVDTVSGEKIQGSDGSVSLTTGDETSGRIEMTLKTDKYDGMQGHSMTAFEELYLIDREDGEETEVLVAEHKDTKDRNQTVEIFQDLKVRKNVTGNLGDLTKIFEYKAVFTGLVPDQSYTVEGDDAKVFNADPSGNAAIPLRLKDGQEVTVKQLPKSAEYRITEKASDHVSEFKAFSEDMADKGAKIVMATGSNGSEAAKELATALETVDMFDGTVVILWENNRDLATITAVQSYIGIWACALVPALAGLLMLIIKHTKYREE